MSRPANGECNALHLANPFGKPSLEQLGLRVVRYIFVVSTIGLDRRRPKKPNVQYWTGRLLQS